MEEIKPQYEHSKTGNFMFRLCANGTKFLVEHQGLYYLFACTWGIIMTVIGLLITFILFICSGYVPTIKFKKYNGIYYICVDPDYGGGFEMGLMFVRDQKSSDDYINPHEFSHSVQNTLFGPLMPFLVSIPSACRYWYQTIRSKKGLPNKPYDAFWAEDAATQCGKWMDRELNKLK